MKSLTINIFGLVQGVGFRYYTKKKAEELNIVGTVENLNDGTVMIQASGSEGAMLSFLKWCHKGPPTGRVDKLHYFENDGIDLDGFSIKR
jgi:acylphosphatase